jgi:hypothetical protein
MLDKPAAKKTTIGAVAANFATRTWPKVGNVPYRERLNDNARCLCVSDDL